MFSRSQRCWVASKMSFMNRSQNNATTGTLSIQLLSSSLSVVNYSKTEKNEIPRTSTRNINLRNSLFLLSDQCLSAKSDRDEIYQQSCHEKRCFECQPIDLVSSKCMVREVFLLEFPAHDLGHLFIRANQKTSKFRIQPS